MDKFLQAYIAAALWSTMDESTPQGGEPLDKNYGPDDLAPETLAKMRGDCDRFQAENAQDIAGHEEQAGHDFWLTRNHHEQDFSTATGPKLATVSPPQVTSSGKSRSTSAMTA